MNYLDKNDHTIRKHSNNIKITKQINIPIIQNSKRNQSQKNLRFVLQNCRMIQIRII